MRQHAQLFIDLLELYNSTLQFTVGREVFGDNDIWLTKGDLFLVFFLIFLFCGSSPLRIG